MRLLALPDFGDATQILELAAISDTPAPSVTRLVFTDRDITARRCATSTLTLTLTLTLTCAL